MFVFSRATGATDLITTLAGAGLGISLGAFLSAREAETEAGRRDSALET